MKVYLAGSFQSGWREKLKCIDEISFIDPSIKEHNNPLKAEEYVAWDLWAIQSSDMVFAYMANTNPSGYGLSIELGYAKALNKLIILILEDGHEKDKYLQFLKPIADVVYNNLEEGIRYLKLFNKRYMV